MEKSDNVAVSGGITTVGKNPNLVSWDLGYRRDENGVVSLDVFITFSSKARAKTGRGDKQDSHTSAYALHLAQTMKIVKDTVPKEENDFRGLNNLVNEMTLIPQRDFFLLEQFNVTHKSTQEFIAAGFSRDLGKETDAQQYIANDVINALNHAIYSAQLYQKSQNSLAYNDNTGHEILINLSSTNTKLLEDLKIGARREYSLNVATKAAEKLLNYQNTAPYVTFSEIPTNDEDEKVFRKAEGSRVRKALGVLMAYSSSDLSVVQDFANEEDLLDEGVENIDDKDLAASTSSAAQQHSTLRQQPKRGKEKFSNLNVGTLTKQNVVYQVKSADELAKEAKNKKKRETEKIVGAICNLLYYPPLNDEDLKSISAANSQNARTNDINVFCYVLTRHLAIILETFNRLDGLEGEDKDAIINGFLDKMLDDWSEVIDKAQIGQPNKNVALKEKKEYMENGIKAALNAWGQERDKIRKEQKEGLISSSGSVHSNDSTENSHSSLNFSLLSSPDYKASNTSLPFGANLTSASSTGGQPSSPVFTPLMNQQRNLKATSSNPSKTSTQEVKGPTSSSSGRAKKLT